MVQVGVDGLDSYGASVNHKLDHMIGNREHGQLVQIDRTNFGAGDALGRIPFYADLAWRFAIQGKIFYASDADFDDRVTGQTSADATTPTFLLRNPSTSNRVCIPLVVTLCQAGTVAGGAIDIIGVLDRADRYSSGGTSEGVMNANTSIDGGNHCLLYTGATASAATAGQHKRVDAVTLGQDVSPAEGAVQIYSWTPQSGIDLMYPGSSMLWYTYAGTTGPTWWWTFKWLELLPEELRLVV